MKSAELKSAPITWSRVSYPVEFVSSPPAAVFRELDIYRVSMRDDRSFFDDSSRWSVSFLFSLSISLTMVGIVVFRAI